MTGRQACCLPLGSEAWGRHSPGRQPRRAVTHVASRRADHLLARGARLRLLLLLLPVHRRLDLLNRRLAPAAGALGGLRVQVRGVMAGQWGRGLGSSAGTHQCTLTADSQVPATTPCGHAAHVVARWACHRLLLHLGALALCALGRISLWLMHNVRGEAGRAGGWHQPTRSECPVRPAGSQRWQSSLLQAAA
jgi:hypothetical protein